jgi:hypothetical protein
MRRFIIAPIVASTFLACGAAPESDVDTIGEDAICQDCSGGAGGGGGAVPTCAYACGASADCNTACKTNPETQTTCGALGFCRTCANFCSPAIACANSCKLPDRSITSCGSYGSCKKYDTYCAYPVITAAAVSDIHENFVGGDVAYMYFGSAYATKKDTFPASIGGYSYDPASAWASNFRGPYRVTGESSRPQWEWYDNAPGGHAVDFGARGTPYVYGKECRSVVAGAAIPALTTKEEAVWEDDECVAGWCNGDDEVGSFRIDRSRCGADVFSRGSVSGWSQVHSAVVGGDVSRVSYKLFCYSCKNAWDAYSCAAGAPSVAAGVGSNAPVTLD